MTSEDDRKRDGVIAKYLASKGTPDIATLTIKRLAKYMKRELNMECRTGRLMDPFWTAARELLKNALACHRVKVGDQMYKVKRVEAYPDYEILFEREGAENNGAH